MKVQEIMTRDVATCGPETDLATAARLMWDYDCGIIPIIDEVGTVLSVVTDRDICIGVATKGRTASHIAVREVASPTLHTCLADDDVSVALDTMKQFKIRRLPVIDRGGHLTGMLSLNDIVLHVKPKAAPTAAQFVDAVRTISGHRRLEAITVATA